MYTTLETAEAAPGAFVKGDAVPAVLVEQTKKATIESFTKICGEVTAMESDITDFTHGMKIDGIISFVGDLTWSMILVMPHDSAELMAKKFAGFDIPYESEDMGDVVGELTNVLAGVLCGGLEAAGVSSQMSLPTVTRGSDFEQLMSDNLLSHRIYFVTNELHFMVKLVVAKHR